MKNLLPRSLQTTIIFLVIGGILALALGGYFTSAFQSLGGSLVGVQSWISSRFIAIQTLVTAPGETLALRQRNIELEAEVARLQGQVIDLQQQVSETQILAALVDFSRANPESTYKGAAVIGRDPSPFLHYVIINRGSNDGILRVMPVVTIQGLIGRVDAVISDAARVQLITDPASAVNVRLQNADTDAVMVGTITGDLSLDLISQDVTIEQGDVVLTSGLGGNYPPDLIVGQVLNIRKRDYELFQQADLQPVVDFSRLELVLIITNFKPVDIQPLIPVPAP